MKPKFYLFAIFLMIPILLGVIVFRSNNIIVDYTGEGLPTLTSLRTLKVGDNLSGKTLLISSNIVIPVDQVLFVNDLDYSFIKGTYSITLKRSGGYTHTRIFINTPTNIVIVNGAGGLTQPITMPSDFGIINTIAFDELKANIEKLNIVFNSITCNLPPNFPNLSHGKVYHDTLNDKYYEYQIDKWVEFQ